MKRHVYYHTAYLLFFNIWKFYLSKTGFPYKMIYTTDCNTQTKILHLCTTFDVFFWEGVCRFYQTLADPWHKVFGTDSADLPTARGLLSGSLPVPLHSSLIYRADVHCLYLFLTPSVSVTLCSRSIVSISLSHTQTHKGCLSQDSWPAPSAMLTYINTYVGCTVMRFYRMYQK